jgi:hypothetical protein
MEALDPSRLRPFPIAGQRDKLARLREVNDQAAKLAACVRRLDADCGRLAEAVRAGAGVYTRQGWRP